MADYTALEVGTTGTEEIAKCPYCGKNGLVEVNNGMTFYLHTKGEGMTKGDIPVTAWDMCPKPLSRPNVP